MLQQSHPAAHIDGEAPMRPELTFASFANVFLMRVCVAGTTQPTFALPRQTFALPLSSVSPEIISGVSAFAFQGTNAHAVLQRPAGRPNTSRLGSTDWQRESLWLAPQLHAMLHSAAVSAAAAHGKGGASTSQRVLTVECQLSTTPRLAYVWDHVVSGKVLFPGAAFFELAAATAKLAAGKAGGQLTVAGVAIPAPLALPSKLDQQQQRPIRLQCSIHLGRGDLHIASSPTAFRQPHLTATAQATVAQDASSPIPASRAWRVRWLRLGTATAPASQAAVDNGQSESTCNIYHAALDSCLQLAAATASDLKIPGSLEALHMPDTLAVPTLCAASRQRHPAAADEPSVIDYHLSGTAGAFGAAIQGLTMKPLGRTAGPSPAANTTTATAATLASSEEQLYEVAWPAAAHASDLQLPAAPAVQMAMQLWPVTDSDLVAAAVAGLQQAQLESSGGVQLSSAGALLHLLTTGGRLPPAADAGLAGMLRALALECPGQRFGSVGKDSLAAGGRASPSTQLAVLKQGSAPAVDAYGTTLHGGLARQAMLLNSKARAALPPFRFMPRPRGAISSLKPEAVAVDTVAPGQVLMAVKAVGINFRWVGQAATGAACLGWGKGYLYFVVGGARRRWLLACVLVAELAYHLCHCMKL